MSPRFVVKLKFMKLISDKNFWASYADLMTSLFFIMLVLFALSFVMYQKNTAQLKESNSILENQKKELEKKNKRLVESEKQVLKVKEIEKSLKNITPTFFNYDSILKKHILNISVQFSSGNWDVNSLPLSQQNALKNVGEVIKDSLFSISQREKNIQFLLIIEGQASRDNYSWDDFHNNDVLSYQRSKALKEFWYDNSIFFNSSSNCELIIAGSGEGGIPRLSPDRPPNNQRFLIYIIPKTGELK